MSTRDAYAGDVLDHFRTFIDSELKSAEDMICNGVKDFETYIKLVERVRTLRACHASIRAIEDRLSSSDESDEIPVEQ